jgi:anti-sigma B factor antagonist
MIGEPGRVRVDVAIEIPLVIQGEHVHVAGEATFERFGFGDAFADILDHLGAGGDVARSEDPASMDERITHDDPIRIGCDLLWAVRRCRLHGCTAAKSLAGVRVGTQVRRCGAGWLDRGRWSGVTCVALLRTMSLSSSKLWVAVTDGTAWVKICGRATFVCSADFRSFVYQLRERGCNRYVLDLTDCVIMDSTFLGMLAGFGLKLGESAGDGVSVRLLNPNERIIDLLDNLGVAQLFQLEPGATPLDIGERNADELVPRADRDELSKTSLEAHETLMAVHPDNVSKFKDVARFLKEDLKKREGGQS